MRSLSHTVWLLMSALFFLTAAHFKSRSQIPAWNHPFDQHQVVGTQVVNLSYSSQSYNYACGKDVVMFPSTRTSAGSCFYISIKICNIRDVQIRLIESSRNTSVAAASVFVPRPHDEIGTGVEVNLKQF